MAGSAGCKRRPGDEAGGGGADVADGPLAPGLYLVATPIGNAADVTLRALDILARADALAAEDTRTARKLMDLHGVALRGRPLAAYHDHSTQADRDRILRRVAEGQSVAYVSEAGTPLVSDPGYRLAADAIAAGLPVTAAPGASALLAALSISGLPCDRFLFAGFPPPKSGARTREFTELAALRATLIFYESPRRLAESLADMARTLGADRPACVARELTKRFEEARRGALAELAAAYAAEGPPKGEVVVLVGPPEKTAASVDDIDAALTEALRTMRTRDAAKAVAERLGAPRGEVYQRALALKDGGAA